MIIGIDCTNIGYGGGGILVANYLNAFHPKLLGIDKFVIWTNPGFAKKLKSKPYSHVIVKDYKSTLKRFYWQTVKLESEAKKFNCNLLIFPGGLYLGKFRPYIAIAQNLLPFHKEALKLYKWKKKYLRYLFLRYLHIKTFSNAEQVYYLSYESKGIIENYFRRQKLETYTYLSRSDGKQKAKQLPNSESRTKNLISRVLQPILSEQFYRTKWIPPNNEIKKILYVSSLKFYKKHIPLCKELKKRVDKGEKLELVLVGDTNNSDAKIICKKIELLNSDKKFITIVGEVNHDAILKYYLEADYYVFPSICETFGIPKYEAIRLELKHFN